MNLSEQFKGISLSDQFLVPPFSILDTRNGNWLKRKRAWLELTGVPGGGPRKIWNEQKTKFKWEYTDDAIKNDHLIHSGIKNRMDKSVFDPVLCEIIYSWFTRVNSQIIDPFAGYSIRGIVASKLNRKYTGIELREDICNENKQAATLVSIDDIDWICDDAEDALSKLESCDFIFSCPPYGDLEVYSKDSRDLSTLTYELFLIKYEKIISIACERLINNRFACFVVGDFRGKDGCLRNFVSHTITAFEHAGLRLYNEMILINVAGSLPNRAAFPFIRTRKIGKQHQNVLIFVKGCPIKATEYCGIVDKGIEL